MYKSLYNIENEKIIFSNIKGHSIEDTTKFNFYFQKLNITPKKLTLDLVKEIQKKHLETFSFNNIAVLLNKPISLNIDDILEKIVTKNLGGYCFEHNKLIHDALLSLGFDVRISIARVSNNLAIETPKTHRITILTFKGEEYLIDVGFGAMTPTTLLKLSAKDTLNQNYKISQDNNKDFVLELSKYDKFITLYKFDQARYTEADCIMGNFYSEHHPKAVFVNNFIVSRKMKDKTLSFRNNCYHQITKTYTNILNIIDAKQLQNILKNDFDIKVSKKESKLLFIQAEEFKMDNL